MWLMPYFNALIKSSSNLGFSPSMNVTGDIVEAALICKLTLTLATYSPAHKSVANSQSFKYGEYRMHPREGGGAGWWALPVPHQGNTVKVLLLPNTGQRYILRKNCQLEPTMKH